MIEVISKNRGAYDTRAICSALQVPVASYYRALNPIPKESPRQRSGLPPLALSNEEELQVLETISTFEFMDMAPATIFATLLERGIYLCSVRTMYRILEKHQQVKERRNQLKHPKYKRPELLATGPNQLWSWDITKLRGAVKYTYFYLYVVLDVFSRYVVGWLVGDTENSALAKQLLGESYHKQNIEPDQLTVHADRGPQMKSKSTAQFLADLGVSRTHSRPHVSNDNPYSEAQFKTLKYMPAYPDRFCNTQDVYSFCRFFFPWYNDVHLHSTMAYCTPADVHYGRAQNILKIRQQTLADAFHLNPKRFKGKMPIVPSLPTEVWINKPNGGKLH